MEKLMARVQVVATSVFTLCAVMSGALVAFSDQIATALPGPWSDRVQSVIVVVVGGLATVRAFIRRYVKPEAVEPLERGLL